MPTGFCKQGRVADGFGAIIKGDQLRVWHGIYKMDVQETVVRGWEGTVPPLSLRGENLRGRNFTREARRKGRDFLRGADLREADLRGARLRGLDLSGADLRGARLQGADFRRTTLAGADLQQVVAGVRRRASVLKGAVGFLCTAMAGFLWATVLGMFLLLRHHKDIQPWGDFVAAIYGVLVFLQLIFLVRRGALPALSAGLSLSAAAGVVVVTFAGVVAIATALMFEFPGVIRIAIAAAFAAAFAAAIVAAGTIAAAFAIAIAGAGTIAGAGALSGALSGALLAACRREPKIGIF